MRYISLFSGIEAATVAWEPLGLEPVAFSEIEPFPCAVLAERFPDVPNLGDITEIDWSSYVGSVDVVVGGSPCFVAGTLVLTESGFKPIESIEVGELVMTHKGRLRKVSKTGSSISDTVILKGQGSVGIECTGNHPFISIEKSRFWVNETRSWKTQISSPEWIPADDMEGRFWLNLGEFEEADVPMLHDASMGVRDGGYIKDFKFGDGFFYFVGRWLGDGWANIHKRKDRIDSNMKRVYVCCSHDEGDVLEAELAETGLHFCRGRERTTERFVCSSTQLFDWITSNFGVHADGKNIPAWCFGMKESYRKAMLKGYLDADGTTFPNGHKSTTISHALALGMKTLAATIGIPTSVVLSKNNRECYIEGRLVNEKDNYCQTYYKSTRSSFCSENGWYGKVRSVSPCQKSQTVYNLEVEDDHTYTADGIVCHNCQSFSIAGKREGLAGESGLMFEYIRAVSEIRPRYFVWENVPGALSSEGGAAFGQLLREMDDLGYGLAWRVLDAQFFGVAQRRRRVWLVGVLGDPERAAEILFEREGMRWDYPSSREKRQELTGAIRPGAGCDSVPVAFKYSTSAKAQTMPTYDGGTTPTFTADWLTTADRHAVAYAMRMRAGKPGGGKGPLVQTDVSGTLATGNDQTIFQPICMASGQANAETCQDLCQAMTARQYKDPSIAVYADDETPMVLYEGVYWTVRRLMPVECERLQGFPDGWTDLGDTPDAPRYKALGNSMAVPVMRWIGERIADVDAARDGSANE